MKNRIILEDVIYIDMYHFQMYEGKFKDVKQCKYLYANVSTFDTGKYEDSDIRIYSDSYTNLYDTEGSELTSLYDDQELCKYLKDKILEMIVGL